MQRMFPDGQITAVAKSSANQKQHKRHKMSTPRRRDAPKKASNDDSDDDQYKAGEF